MQPFVRAMQVIRLQIYVHCIDHVSVVNTIAKELYFDTRERGNRRFVGLVLVQSTQKLASLERTCRAYPLAATQVISPMI